MPNRPALITQAEIARCIRAAKQAGAAGVEIRRGDTVISIPLSPSSTSQQTDGWVDPDKEIVL